MTRRNNQFSENFDFKSNTLVDLMANSKMISTYVIYTVYNHLRILYDSRLFGSTGEDCIGSWGSNFSRIRLTFRKESTDSVSPFEIDSPRDDSKNGVRGHFGVISKLFPGQSITSLGKVPIEILPRKRHITWVLTVLLFSTEF